jgi:hypothetical protein
MWNSKEIAFYYPGPMWHHDDWIKTMILFVDGIGILLPDYLKGKPEREDPPIAIPLREQGLLHILEPEQIVDKALLNLPRPFIASRPRQPIDEQDTV